VATSNDRGRSFRKCSLGSGVAVRHGIFAPFLVVDHEIDGDVRAIWPVRIWRLATVTQEVSCTSRLPIKHVWFSHNLSQLPSCPTPHRRAAQSTLVSSAYRIAPLFGRERSIADWRDSGQRSLRCRNLRRLMPGLGKRAPAIAAARDQLTDAFAISSTAGKVNQGLRRLGMNILSF